MYLHFQCKQCKYLFHTIEDTLAFIIDYLELIIKYKPVLIAFNHTISLIDNSFTEFKASDYNLEDIDDLDFIEVTGLFM